MGSSFDPSVYLPETTTRRKSTSTKILPQDRPFIAWDGEGENLDGPDMPQSYTLFGCSTGDYVQSPGHLGTFVLLDFIVDIGKRNPSAWHVGFAFNYDVNMIVQSLTKSAIEKLHKTGQLSLRSSEGKRYHIRYTPSKSFSVTGYDADYHYKSNRRAKTTVKIYDIFSFFGTSFVKAYESTIGHVPAIVVEGKRARGTFESRGADYVHKYWRAEIDLLRELADELRRRMYGANLRIREWHGPGALASYVNKQHAINGSMAQSPELVRKAARYAYAGGRFEIFRFGRTRGPVYSLDINSAYPHAIRQVPNLANGEWVRVERPTEISRFGVYHVRLLPQAGDSFLPVRPGPLFHRDKMGNISFPWVLDGWYWSPEVRNVVKWIPANRYEIVEGWVFRERSVTTAVSHGLSSRPYSWVSDMYSMRRLWKKQGNASQLALKLCMNSLYGKMAQRVGWNEAKRTAPTWHQLEWAGWVTSYCRAMLWDAMQRIPIEQLIAVETDGLYTTMHPVAILGDDYRNPGGSSGESRDYVSSTDLGGWEVDEYDEILYIQSGLAWLRQGTEWTAKRRGLDAKTFGLDDCRSYLGSLDAGGQWPAYSGGTTRFIGMGAALSSSTPFKLKHCRWESVDRDIRPGQNGKRIHVHRQCPACIEGLRPSVAAHQMTIRSLAYFDPQSYEHDIPWENGDQGYLHRQTPDIGEPDYEEYYS